MRKILCVMAMIGVGAIVSACGGGGGGAATGSNTASGIGSKGPFQQGATVTAYKLNPDGTRSTATLSTTVTDNLGHYNLANIPWSGLTEIVITGNYFDEVAGAVSAAPATMSTIVNLPAIGGAVNATTASPNVASTVAAEIAKQALVANPGANPSAVLQTANLQAASALGLPTQDANGNPIDLSKLDVTNTADPALGAANQALLTTSATVLDTAAATGQPVTQLAASFATDATSGQPLGTTLGVNPQVVASQNKVSANAATIANNLNTAVQSAGGTPNPNLPAQLPTVAKKTVNSSASVLHGLAMNQFTLGNLTPVTYTVAKNGAATIAPASLNTTVATTDVVVSFNVTDLTNAGGNGPAVPGVTYAAVINFDIKETGNPADKRAFTGSLPVTVTTDGLGNVSIAVPAGAVLTYSGSDAAGAAFSGTSTNIQANTISANGATVTIDANALLGTAVGKTGQAAINILNAPGTFTATIGIAGVKFGHLGLGGAIDQLFPAGATTGGHAITATFTTI